MEEEQGVAQEGAAESPAAGETSQPEKSEENAIPHSRVREMVSKARDEAYRTALKELMNEDSKPKEEVKEVKQPEQETEQAKAILDEVISKHLDPVKRQLAQQQVEKFLDSTPDAPKYIDKMKSLRQDNKSLSWEDAYKLASYDEKLKERESKGIEQGTAQRSIKQSAQTEKPTAAKQESPKTLADKMRDKRVPLSQLEAELREKLGG